MPLTRSVVFLLGGLLLVALPAQAELAAWDQAAVTSAAADVATTSGALQDALRLQNPPTVSQPGRRAFFRLRDDVSTLVSASGRLQRALEGGATQEETLPTYRRLLTTARDAERETRSIGLGEPVTGKIAATAGALRKLRTYYEEPPSL